jgi:hypothetical protein
MDSFSRGQASSDRMQQQAYTSIPVTGFTRGTRSILLSVCLAGVAEKEEMWIRFGQARQL